MLISLGNPNQTGDLNDALVVVDGELKKYSIKNFHNTCLIHFFYLKFLILIRIFFQYFQKFQIDKIEQIEPMKPTRIPRL